MSDLSRSSELTQFSKIVALPRWEPFNRKSKDRKSNGTELNLREESFGNINLLCHLFSEISVRPKISFSLATRCYRKFKPDFFVD